MSSRTGEPQLRQLPNNTNTNTCDTSTTSTVLKNIQFGGVPIVLLLDLVVFLLLLLLFTAIRKKLWDYGRLALVSEVEGFNESTHRRYGRLTSTVEDPETETGCCAWLPFVLTMDSEEVKAKCGMDAVHYLSFQRHLIFLLTIVTVGSLCVILPVNVTGDLIATTDPSYDFGRMTIGNLREGDKVLWLHTVFAVLYLILTVVLLRRFTSQMKGMRRETTRNTLFLRSVPKEATDEELKTHFAEAYPSCQVTAVTLGYDVAKVMQLDKERMRAQKNLRYYEKDLQRTRKRRAINPRLCGYLCCCECCNSQEVDAIEYYSNQEAALAKEVSKHRELVPQRPLGVAFVTLQSEAMANLILKDFNALDCGRGVDDEGSPTGCSLSGRDPQLSARSASLKVRRWKVCFAPHPNNVYWENLSVQGAGWWVRCLLLNLFLIVLLTFFTTPSIIISTMDKLNIIKPISQLTNAVISQFFPTLLLWSFSALLPTVVYYSTLGEAHWSRSSEQLSMMHKLYIFLLFMVLILPSLGLTSINLFLLWLFDEKFLIDGKTRFECIFLPDQGAFFVNYVIAAALIGSGMDLLRLPGLLLYAIRMMLARSAAERKYVKQNQAYEFEYGAMYSWTLCVFAVIMSYSITCPIIAPFGLMYMGLKHLVDKHNLYFTFLPTHVDRNVHLSAVSQALAAPVMCLIWLYFFSVVRMGFMAIPSLFTLVVLCITVMIFIGYNCFGNFKYLSPHNYSVKADEEAEENAEQAAVHSYLPRVLSTEEEPEGAQSPESYGSLNCSPVHSPKPGDDNLLMA